MLTSTFTDIFEADGAWWIGSVEELPGANPQGATLDEARASLQDAVACAKYAAAWKFPSHKSSVQR